MRKQMYHVCIPEDSVNVNLLKVLEEKKIIKEYLLVKHIPSGKRTKPHFHIFIDLYNPLEKNKVRLWFKTYMFYVEEVKGEKSEMIAYMLDDSQNVKVIGAKHEKKAL